MPALLNPRSDIAVVLPVKRFGEAKYRLRGLLDSPARAGLARAMYLDVLDALMRAVAPAGVYVVTADPDAARLAAERGCRVVAERTRAGLNAALLQGVAAAAAAGWTGVLALPSDLPLLEPADILDILNAHPRPAGVTLVPSIDGRGTNALCCSPPGLIDLHYGEDSFRLHLAAARATGHPTVVLQLARIALDVDTPDDVAAFLGKSGPGSDFQLFEKIGLGKPETDTDFIDPSSSITWKCEPGPDFRVPDLQAAQ